MPEPEAPPTEGPPPDGVAIEIDGHEVVAREGELLIDAAERTGTYIPRFCYHERMRPVGMCRMCIVEVDTGRGPALQPSCMLECSPGMKVSTDSEVTKKAQDGILEFLLINHPLDCPVCDKGGECPLQDQTMAYGPGESRFVEEKRHNEKPIPISDLVLLDRERCILCDRCTRFAKEVAGDPLIHFIHRGNSTEVNTFPDEPFSSYFSGNTVQICPVGALTASTYRFKARPWDLQTTESTCQQCSVGCRISIDSSRDQVQRYAGVDVDPVNWGWLCDKGRFSHEVVAADGRLPEPLVRDGDELVPARWADALNRAADALRDVAPDAVGVVGGARLTNEDAYAWAKLAKGVLGTDNVDAQLGDGLPAELVLGLPRATIDRACTPGGTVLLIGCDPKEELPVLFLRLRHAVVEDGATLVEVAPRTSGTTPLASASLVHRPGEAGALVRALVAGAATETDVAGISAAEVNRVRAMLARLTGPLTVVLGRGSAAESAVAATDAASAVLEARPEARFLPALRRANVHGALDMGLAPGLLPGRVGLDDGREWFAEAWPALPAEPGLDTEGILRAAADGRIDVLVLLGADPLADFPDHDLAERALAGARTVIALDTILNESSRHADVVLAAAGFAEKAGTTTNLEGRVSALTQRVTPPGTARPDWMLASELALRLGADLGFTTPAEVLAEIGRCAPAHAGLSVGVVEAAPDGVLLPTEGEPTDRDATGDEGGQQGAEADAAAVRAEAADTTEATEAEAEASARAEAEATADDGTDAAVPGEAAEGAPPAAPAPTSGPARPELVSFAGSAAAPVPPHDAYGFRLVATRKLYDQGTLVQAAGHLAGLAPEAAAHLNPADAVGIGVADGDRVVLRGARSSLTLPVRLDDGVPRGAVAVPANQSDARLGDLVTAGEAVTELRIETAR
jgi:NADH-quinone oxidoreductase subunit G